MNQNKGGQSNVKNEFFKQGSQFNDREDDLLDSPKNRYNQNNKRNDNYG